MHTIPSKLSPVSLTPQTTSRPAVLPLAAAFWLGASLPLVASSPDNDHFANAVLLTGSPAVAVGNNAGAGLEAAEFNPRGRGGASVWYRWVAPASGWFEATTFTDDPAHDLDTVLVLHRAGASAAEAPVMGFNEEAYRPDLDAWVDQSRLVFQAAAGTEYRVAVHGWEGATGAFRLTVGPVPTPAARVASVGFSPGAVDVGAAAAASTAAVRVLTDAPFDGAFASLHRYDSTGTVGSAYLSPDERASGTAWDGIYEAALEVSAFRAPGAYPLRVSIWAENQSFSWTPEGGDQLADEFLIPSGGHLTVNNTGQVDSAPPVLNALSGLPATVDLTNGNVTLPLEARITDALSGFAWGEVVLVVPNDRIDVAEFDDGTLVNGNLLDGKHETRARFTTSMPLGTHPVIIDLRDHLGNRVRYGAAGNPPLPAGIPTTITLTATSPSNDNFSSAQALNADNLPIVTGSTAFSTREGGEPALDGRAGGSVWFEWTAQSGGWTSLQVSSEDETPIVGLFTGTAVNNLVEIGRNNGSITDAEWQRQPLVFLAEAGQSYKIAVCSPADSYAPGEFQLELTSLAAPPALRVTNCTLLPGAVDVGGGSQSVTIQVVVESDAPLLADIFSTGWLTASLTPDPGAYSGPGVSVTFFPGDRILGTPTHGTYQASVVIPAYLPPAFWDLSVEGSLASGPAYRWSLQGENPLPDSLLVPQSGQRLNVGNSGLIDTEAPVLASLSGLPASINVSGGGAGITLSLAVGDEGGGFDRAYLFLFPDGFPSSIYGLGTVTAAHRISGTANSGVYQIPYTFAADTPPGRYYITVTVEDQSGNRQTYGPGYDQEPPPPGSSFHTQITNSPGGYAAWAADQNFGPANLHAPAEDPNQDGVSNLLCYAFNLTPNGPTARPLTPGAGGTAGLPAAYLVGEGQTRRLRIEFLRRTTPGSGLTYTPQFGHRPGPDGMQDGGVEIAVTPAGPGWERVIVEDPETGAKVRFGRVRVVLEE